MNTRTMSSLEEQDQVVQHVHILKSIPSHWITLKIVSMLYVCFYVRTWGHV